MIKRFIHLLAIPSVLILGSCATGNQVAQQVDQNDDVYYSVATAKEEVAVIAQEKKSEKPGYVTDEQLYRDAYDDYYGDYAARIYRFRNYTPWRSYYNDFYSFYDPFYLDAFSPFGWGGRPALFVGVNMGSGFFNYNPWRYYGYNYGSNFWGPYSYYGSWMPSMYGYFPGGWYGGGYGNWYNGGHTIYTSPNYRARPGRAIENVSYGGAANGVIRNGNGGNVIQSGGRAERYNGGSTRPQSTAPRPERVQRAPASRPSQPERVSSSPRTDPGSSSGSSAPSNGGSRSNSGGGGARPSRAN